MTCNFNSYYDDFMLQLCCILIVAREASLSRLKPIAFSPTAKDDWDFSYGVVKKAVKSALSVKDDNSATIFFITPKFSNLTNQIATQLQHYSSIVSSL